MGLQPVLFTSMTCDGDATEMMGNGISIAISMPRENDACTGTATLFRLERTADLSAEVRESEWEREREKRLDLMGGERERERESACVRVHMCERASD